MKAKASLKGGVMRGSASASGKSVTSEDVERKKPFELAIPVREIDNMESLALGFRQNMLEVGSGKESGGVDCGAGCGTDYIILEWKGRKALVRGTELFKAWVKTFDSEAAERMPT